MRASMAETAKILLHAAESFSTLQRLVDVTRGTVPPATSREMQAQVKKKAREARIHLNGKANIDRTLPEEEGVSVVRLLQVLDEIDEVEPEEAPKDEEEEETPEEG
jgi:hypothetical protein